MLFNFLEEVEDMTIKTSMRNLKIIDKACQLQFIEELYEAGVYAFVHDRVREAFYQMIKPEDRIQLHFKIAQTLEKNILKYKNSYIGNLLYADKDAKDFYTLINNNIKNIGF